MSPKIAVIAGNKKEFDNFIKYSCMNKNLYIYIAERKCWRGCRFTDVLSIGTYFERKDIFNIKVERCGDFYIIIN